MPIPVEERELHELDEKISDLAGRERTEREQADQVIARLREEGRNPTVDNDAFNEVDAAYRSADSTRDELAQLRERRAQLSGRSQPTPTDRPQDNRPANATRGFGSLMAQRFLDSAVLEEVRKSGAIGNKTPFTGGAAEVLSREETRQFLAAEFDGTPLLPEDQRMWPPVGIPTRSVRILDLITIAETERDVVKWTEELTVADAAAFTARGELIPEAGYVYVPRTAEVGRIAHFLPGHEDDLSDEPRLRTWLPQRLERGVRLATEDQVLEGDGLGENVTGILNTVGIANQPRGADTVPDAIHKGMTLVRIGNEDEPTAVGLHPLDWERYVLDKGNDGHYLHQGPTTQGTQKFAWGLPAVISTVFTEGQAVVADWSYATLFVREGISTQVTNQYADFFRRYMIAFRSGMRAAFAVTQRNAFATVSDLNVEPPAV